MISLKQSKIKTTFKEFNEFGDKKTALYPRHENDSKIKTSLLLTHGERITT